MLTPILQVAAFMAGDTVQALAEVYGVGLTRGRRLPLIQVTRADVTRTTLMVSLTLDTRCLPPPAPGAR